MTIALLKQLRKSVMNFLNIWHKSARQTGKMLKLLLDVRPEEAMSIIRSSNLGAIISFLNTVLIVVCFHSAENTTFNISWLAISTLLFLAVARRSAKAQHKQISHVSPKAVKRLALYTLGCALPWIILTIAFLGSEDPRNTIMVLMVCAGMSAGGGFMLYRVPLAALIYAGSILLTVASIIAIQKFSELWPVIFYALTFGISLVTMVFTSWRIAREREDSLLQAAKANSDLHEANEKIRKLALRDSLTELANREAFLEILEQRIASKNHEKFAVFLLDLDNFKNVNDSIGHTAGDELLKIVTQRLLKAVRKTDVIARLGGDEFALIINVYENDKLPSIVAERILTSLVAPVLLEGALIHPNASIGIARYPDHANSPEDFLRFADIALHAAKKAGRGRFEIYDTKMAVTLARVEEIEHALRKALSNDEMQLYYQPKVDIRTGALTGAEALLRWFNNNAIATTTLDLFDVAEERGMIPQISSFVFGRAAQDILHLQSLGLMSAPISINIHPYDLKTPELLLERLRNTLESGVRKTDIILEVTEGCFVGRGSDEARMILDTIHEMGVKLSLDDFGTGHAALSHLKHLPVSELKIDREFINGICDDKRDKAITIAALEIAKCLEIDCVAEGIESAEQANALIEMDKSSSLIGQGYFWAKPMPFEEFIQFCKKQQAEGLLPPTNTTPSIKLQGTQ